MKVNVSSVARVLSNRSYSQIELVAVVGPVTGKSASVEVDNSANGDALIAASKIALAIDASKVTNAVLMKNDAELDGSKSLVDLGIIDGSSIQIRFYIQIA